MKKKITLNDIKDEIRTIRKRCPTFKDDAAFVFWFLNTYLTGNENEARNALTGKEGGRGGEKNIDGIYIDDNLKQCNIIQGKFHISEGYKEKRNDVLGFAALGTKPWEGKSIIETFYSGLDPIALEKFQNTINCVKNKKYKLNLYYITTGECTNPIIEDAKAIARQAEGSVEFFMITIKQLLKIFKDYLDDITPHIPPLKLRIVSEGVIQHEGLIRRFDPETKIESWVLSVCGADVGDMYTKVGRKLFAKNIRGYLGPNTDINESITETIKREPDNFWYYNNGVTIVCDEARREIEDGEDSIIIHGAQVINGQQTTRALNNTDSKNANVLVKIIKIPRDLDNEGNYDRLVNAIVKATNWQNYISPSDLISNDEIQIYLERELRKINYQYIRKKMSKSEARSWFGHGYWQIDKREMVQSVGACLFDPLIIRKGKEGLFEDPYYKSIFNSRQLSFYLSKYWLMRQVQYVSTGYPQRAYAKWLVLNFIWSKIGGDIGSGHLEKHFRYACEVRNSSILNSLQNALVLVFRSVLKFYRANRGKGEEAKDISSFFQAQKLHLAFKKFWESSKNSYRSRFNYYIGKFKKRLRELEIEQ